MNRFIALIVFVFVSLANFAQYTPELVFNARVTYKGSNLPDVKVQLLKGEDGEIVKEIETDKSGKINFRIPTGKDDYRIELSKKNYLKSYVAVEASASRGFKKYIGSEYNTELVMVKNSQRAGEKCWFDLPVETVVWEPKGTDKGRFVVKEMPEKFRNKVVCEADLVKEEVVAEVKEIKYITISGKVIAEETGKPLRNKLVELYDGNGVLIEKTKTNTKGSFAFAQLEENTDFKIIIDAEENKISGNFLLLSNAVGDDVSKAEKTGLGKFIFSFLKGDKQKIDLLRKQPKDLKMNLVGYLNFMENEQESPLNNVNVSLISPKGDVIKTSKTNNDGKFKFKTMSPDDEYSIRVAEDDLAGMNISELILKDKAKHTIKTTKLNPETGNFDFQLLPFEKVQMTEMYVEDPWMEIIDDIAPNMDVKIVERVEFELDKAEIMPSALPILENVVFVLQNNKGVNVEIGAHTDSRGDDAYNQKLSQQRADAVKRYLLSNQVDASRIIAKGYGETALVNKCANNVECSEEEHARNRRVEFKIIK